MVSIGKISIGINTKKYSHNLSHHVNTTCEFGFPQPIFCRPMLARDKVSYTNRQLVRFNSLVAPTFGECKSINVARFVPMSDVFPSFDALQAHETVRGSNFTYIPTESPTITNTVLFYFLASRSFINAFDREGNHLPLSSIPNLWDKANYCLELLSNWLFAQGVTDYNLYSEASTYFKQPTNESSRYGQVAHTLSSSDFVIFNPDYNQSRPSSFPATDVAAIGIRFGVYTSRIAKVLRGLGFNLEPTNNDPKSILRVLAYYKAWFDMYSAKRDVQWTDTPCYGFINHIYNFGTTKLYSDTSHLSDLTAFLDIVYSLRNCWYSCADDFFSIHRSKANNSSNLSSNIFGIPNLSVDSSGSFPQNYIQSSDNQRPEVKISGVQSSINLISLETLRRLTRFQNKNNIIGRSIYKYISVHYGAKTAEDLFRDSYNVGEFVLQCIPDDIMNQSDTAVIDSEGSKTQGGFLGQYGGYCKKFSKGSFRFRADVPGFLFVVNTVIPVSSYYQGDDPTLSCIDRYTLPNHEFDALGYQVTPVSQMYDNNGVVDWESKLGDDGFGFVPYMSSIKQCQNLVNGDFRNRSFASSYEPYFLDHTINTCMLGHAPNNSNYIGTLNFPIPKASTLWRFPYRFKYLGNFERIFNNQHDWKGSNVGGNVDYWDSMSLADNIILQCNVSASHTNMLKPLSMSFDTIDETDNETMNVKPE